MIARSVRGFDFGSDHGSGPARNDWRRRGPCTACTQALRNCTDAVAFEATPAERFDLLAEGHDESVFEAAGARGRRIPFARVVAADCCEFAAPLVT